MMAYGSLAYGMLTGTLSEEKAFEKGDWRAKRGQLIEPQPVSASVRSRAFPQ